MIGSILTGYIYEKTTNKLWEKQVNYEAKRSVLQKRSELIDKTASVFGKSPGISDVWRTYLNELDKNKLEIKNTDLSEKLAQYNSEYYSVISLDQLYFGSKTRAVIDELGKDGKPWWEISKDKTDKLLRTMVEELNIFDN